jgi:hypothetical protein
MGERVRALKLLRSVTAGMLLMWDRGLHSYSMVEATVSKGCEYLGLIPSNVKFLNETQLDDGSYLSWIYPSGKLRKKGFKPIQVRVIEYTIENYDRPEAQIRYRLIIPIHYEGTLKYMVKVEEIQYGEQTSGTNPGNG